MVDAPRSRLVLVRHGATEWSDTGQHTGRTDLELTDSGRHQAAGIRTRLDGVSPELVLTSPSKRAVETCEATGWGASAERTEDALEWDYGVYEGRTTVEIREEHEGWTMWDDGAPGGETIEQVEARADRLVARARAVDGDVLLFSHGHFLRVLAARWLGLPGADGRLLKLDTAAICVLGWEREQPVVIRWNVAADGL